MEVLQLPHMAAVQYSDPVLAAVFSFRPRASTRSSHSLCFGNHKLPPKQHVPQPEGRHLLHIRVSSIGRKVNEERGL